MGIISFGILSLGLISFGMPALGILSVGCFSVGVLAAHALFPISTGKLEGFNNKIKVAKRIGYGYRAEDYFFTLIRYLSLPTVRRSDPTFP